MALIVQTAQTAVCNRHHSIEQQLRRWLSCMPTSNSTPLPESTIEWIPSDSIAELPVTRLR